MNELITEENINIENMIYEIRGKQVMLSSDVAKLYQVETKRINEVIKRNINRFPKEFCFQLTLNEIEELRSRSQIATLNKNGNLRGNNIKYLPFVLTEQGIMMLSGLLKSDIAVKVNIQIINAFVAMRNYISNNLIEQKYINNLVLENHENIKLLQDAFEKLEEKTKVNSIFYEGQIYDSFSLLLDILKNIDKKIIIISKNINETLKNKYQKQYNNIIFKNNNTFHDRFILIDNKELYHSGASFKDLGKKCFAIYKLENTEEINYFTSKISEVKN